MGKKVFSIYMGNPDCSNHAELDLPATPWELIDALDKLRLEDGREPYWQVEDIGRYLWLSNPVAIEYIRNCLKRVRKRDSALVMASQNLEDFDQEGVREMTKPLFAIPPHQFLFNPGSIGKQFYMDMLQLDEAEFELIQRARRGECLYKCGMERYHLEVKAPTHKAVLFGSAGGR